MLKRWRAEALDRELARHNPVSDADLADAARAPAATALLRHIFDLADGVAEMVAEAGDPPAETGAGTSGDAAGRGRRLATALTAIALLAGGTLAVALSVGRTPIPHRATTLWLASRPLAADTGTRAMSPMSQRSSWQLVGDIVPAGWKLGTPGPGPGTVTCPTMTVCYVTGDTSTSASGPSVLGGLYVSTNGASSWSVLALPQGFTFTSELSCVSAMICAAGGTEDGTAVFAETRDGGHRWTVTTTGAAGGIARLACLSASRCMALSLPLSDTRAIAAGTSTPRPFDEKFVRTSDGGNRWTATPLPATVHFSALQCTSATACVTVGYPSDTDGAAARGVALWTDDGGARWERGVLPGGVGFSGISGLSCKGPVRCMAVGTVAVPNPSQCSSATQSTQSTQAATLTAPTSVSCTSGATAWISAMLTTENEGATWQLAPLPASVPQPRLDDVACAAPLACWAGGQESVPSATSGGSSVLVGTADGGATWMSATVPVPARAPNDKGGDAYSTVGSLSCPSTTVCVALGVVDQGARFAPVYRMDLAP